VNIWLIACSCAWRWRTRRCCRQPSELDFATHFGQLALCCAEARDAREHTLDNPEAALDAMVNA
jgi:hypothetical protein